jgi:hypothetical protein
MQKKKLSKMSADNKLKELILSRALKVAEEPSLGSLPENSVGTT